MPKSKTSFAPIDFRDRFPALDGVRALAVTLVFAHHYGGGSHGGRVLNLINKLREQGWVGVDVFFVLSGFLITGILYDTRNDSQFFKRFFARRSVRIFPVFYLLVAVMLALTPILHYQWRVGHLAFLVYMGNIVGNLNFDYYAVFSSTYKSATMEIGHLWSLCVEEQFYLLWPIMIWWLRDRKRILWAACLLALGSLALRCFVYFHYGSVLAEVWSMRSLPTRMDTLLIGGIMALLLRGPNADRWQRLSGPLLVVSSAIAIFFCVRHPSSDAKWLLTFGLTLTALASAGLIGLTLRSGSMPFRLFYLKPLRILGKYSYGFYLFHLVFAHAWIEFLVKLYHVFHSLAVAGIVALTVNFVVTFFLAKLSYDHFEVKFLRYKRHFEYDSEIAADKHAFTTK